MVFWDWVIVGIYCVMVTVVGLAFRKRAEGGVDDYFLSGRQLPWWLAGTSLIATSFASDTPLFVTGLVRKQGVAGNWHWWFMALASMAALFFFSRLWRRARIVTDMEFIELRYGSGPGAVLRGAKALFLGVLFNAYVLGAWPVLGLTKVLEEATQWSKAFAVAFCAVLALVYSAFSGLWGVVATDFIQFFWALGGAVVLAIYALDAVGGIDAFWEKAAHLNQAAFLPAHTPDDFWQSPAVFLASLFLVQWWARGVEGDGVAVQRMSACKDEKHSFFAMLWFNIGQYALRPWPWVVVALCSLMLMPEVFNAAGAIDHERAYPRMLVQVLPTGMRGLVIASFFAAFMSTVDTHLNWGASYVVNDVYRRFVKHDAPPRHYVAVSRIVTVLLMGAGGVIALLSSSIVDAFYAVLLLFSGTGLVGLARWFWWRINAWSEISAMLSSGLLTWMASPLCRALGLPDARPVHLLVVVIGSIAVWLPVTLLTPPVARAQLQLFYERVRPAGPGWKRALGEQPRGPDSLGWSALGWICGVCFIFAITIGLGQLVLGQLTAAAFAAVVAAVGLGGVVAVLRRMRWR